MSDWTPVLLAVIAALPGLAALMVSKRKTASDPYPVLLDALQKSGQTIDDLMETISTVPQMKSDLKSAQDRITAMEHDFNQLLAGAWALHAQVLEMHGTPRYTPPRDLAEAKEPDSKTSGTHKTPSGFGRK